MEARRSQLNDERTAVSVLEAELAALKRADVTEEAVRSHPLYLHNTSKLTAASEKLHESLQQMSKLDARIASLTEILGAERKRVDELTRSAAS